ncbi:MULTISPECIES: PH domain-containing protein [unclassified Crossiella]|uniref:PH domain-containing protein n=1 Tax=unclassified Crossiella TaxID=2620835 RepID=UPI002000244D|nr:MULTISPECIES: PH domain-containing protein [unclassified Crossiella]MCK2241309.1 PH domain-containing protein [Crossiella sp. S99.2]MCK2253547.1 PH domain-containing protein [Crossiella sp. S99.1]
MSQEARPSEVDGFAVAPEAPDAVVVEQDWQRLHKRTVVVAPLSEIAGLLGVAFLLLVVRGFSGLSWIEMGIGITAAVALIVFGVLRWYTTRYRVTSTHVELHTGLVFKKERSVARDRLRTVDATADVFHRIFGLSVVKIGTGRQDQGTEDELSLDAIDHAEADRLRALLLRRLPAPVTSTEGLPPVRPDGSVAESAEPESAAADSERVLTKLDPKWLRFAPFTLFGLIAVGALGAAGAWLARTLNIDVAHLPASEALLGWIRHTPIALVIALALGVLLVLAVLGSLVVYVLSYWNYKLTRRDDGTVHVAYGLLTLRSVTIEEKRIKGVELHEQLLLRQVKGATVKAVATGLGTGQDSGMLLPPAPVAEAHRVVAEILRVDPAPTATPLRKHPRAALRRLMLWDFVVLPVIIGGLAVLAWQGIFPDWPWQAALALIPVVLLISWDEYRNLGHALTEKYLVSRSGSVLRNTVVLQRTGIIGWRIRQSILQRRAHMLTVGATSATSGGVYEVQYVDQTDGLELAEAAVPELLTPFLERG